MTGPSCPWPHASVAGAMRAISRVSHTFAWRGHDPPPQASHHGHDTPFMPPPSCPDHSQVLHVGVEEEERVGCVDRLAKEREHSIGAVGEVPRSQTREQTPRKLNPTRTITNVERCPIARSAPQRNRDSAPPAQDPAGAAPGRAAAGPRRTARPRRGPDDNNRLPPEL